MYAIPIIRFLKSGSLDSLKKTLTCFVIQEEGSISAERLGYISKIVQLSIEGFETMPEEWTAPINQPKPVKPDRVQSVVERTSPVLTTKKLSLAESFANMILTLENHKTRSIEVSSAVTTKRRKQLFFCGTSRVLFLDQARQSGWIDDITPKQHHHWGMLINFSKYWCNNFDDIARENVS
jgi:hypothetical protein